MISSILIDKDRRFLESFEYLLQNHFPFIEVNGKANCINHFNELSTKASPDLLFVNSDFLNNPTFSAIQNKAELIFILNDKQNLPDTVVSSSFNYLLKPIQRLDLINIVNNAKYRILAQRERNKNNRLIRSLLKFHPQKEIIGIPTIEGYEFIAVKKIIRCEGLQKCTRVVTVEKSNIVSSYNLGEFKKILEPFGFFLPHRSFLINLKHIKKYQKEGTITMSDNSSVPVARRRMVKNMLPHFLLMIISERNSCKTEKQANL